jgi:hypothetical protein
VKLHCWNHQAKTRRFTPSFEETGI